MEEQAQAEHKRPSSHTGRIDTHIHLYDTRREGSCTFLNPSRHAQIYTPHLAKAFLDTAQPAGINHAVVVEASRRREDNEWLLDLVNNSEAMLACIGNLDPRDPNFASDLDSLAAHPKFRGIRIRPRKGIDISKPPILEALRLLEKRNLVLELGTPGNTTEAIVAVARHCPKLHIIMNHLAGGRLKNGQIHPEQWQAQLQALAKEPNIFCKISALYSLSDRNAAPTDASFYKPLIDPVVDAFGPDRVLFGSNWTLSEMYGSYSDMITMLDGYLDTRADLLPERFYGLNALQAYDICAATLQD